MQTNQSKGRQRRLKVALAAVTIAGGLLMLAPAPALAGGGLKPSQAPLITAGQHYFGNTEHEWNAGCCTKTVDLWRLPPLMTADVLTIAWHANPSTGMCLAQDVDDYNWAEDYPNGSSHICNGSQEFYVSGSGSARATVEARSATANGFLEFVGRGAESPYGSYDFVIESIQHAIGVSLDQRFRIRRNVVVTAHANLADGSPVPDGFTFYLNVRLLGQRRVHYQAVSSSGTLRFPLALPARAIGQTAAFNVTRPADASYLRASSASLHARVARARAPRTARHHRHHRRHHRRRTHRHKTRR